MEKASLSIVFIFWMLITLIFVFTIVGLLVVLKTNNTGYFKYENEMRSSWMQLGFDIKEKLLK